MNTSENLLENYNKLVKEWNKRFGHYCEGMPVRSDDFCQSYRSRIRKLFSRDISARRKVSITKTVIGDFDTGVNGSPNDDRVQRGELAHSIVLVCKKLLRQI
jgi:hypothetical protein